MTRYVAGGRPVIVAPLPASARARHRRDGSASLEISMDAPPVAPAGTAIRIDPVV
jgi:hypothetical protein